MRARPEELHFAQTLLDIGEGTTTDSEGYVKLPDECPVISDVETLAADLFKDPINRQDWNTLAERVILCPLNSSVDERNNEIMEMMPVNNPEEDEAIYYSIDSAQCEKQHMNAEDYPIEFLHTLSPSGILLIALLLIFQTRITTTQALAPS